MIIAGAGGHGLEVRHELIHQGISSSEIIFFDDDDSKLQRKAIQSAGVITKIQLQKHLTHDPYFVLGVGNPILREKLFHLLTNLGGRMHGVNFDSTLLSKSSSKVFDAMSYSFIGPEVTIGIAVLVNTRAHIHHDCVVGDFCEIAPGAMLLGGSKIGRYCRIGAGAVILPGIELGDGIVVGAGAVVTKSVYESSTLVGVPAKVL